MPIEATITLVVIAVILVLVGIAINNAIIERYNRVKQAWADVLTQERQKEKILPKLEKMVNEYKLHESDLMTKVTELRTCLNQLDPSSVNTQQLTNVENASKSMMAGLTVAVEAYPELKAAEVYSQLMSETAEQEENVGASIRIFNSNIAAFNTGIEVFPNSFINSSFTKKKEMDTYSDQSAETNVGFTPKF